jgi:hypothetical protein
MSRAFIPTPPAVLEDHTVAVGVLKRFAMRVPVRIEGGDGRVAMLDHPRHGSLPYLGVGKVEDKQVVWRRRATCHMPALARELEVILLPTMAQHDAVKAVVVGERVDDLEAESVAVEAQGLVPSIGGTRDTQMHTHLQGSDRSTGRYTG